MSARESDGLGYRLRFLRPAEDPNYLVQCGTDDEGEATVVILTKVTGGEFAELRLNIDQMPEHWRSLVLEPILGLMRASYLQGKGDARHEVRLALGIQKGWGTNEAVISR